MKQTWNNPVIERLVACVSLFLCHCQILKVSKACNTVHIHRKVIILRDFNDRDLNDSEDSNRKQIL